MPGPRRSAWARPDAREVMLKVGVRHPVKDALELFSREVAPMALMSAPAITGFTGGRPKVQPVVRLFSCLVPKAQVAASIDMGGQTVAPPPWLGKPFDPASLPQVGGPLPAADAFARGTRTVPLVKLAWGRSGDKGDAANIGILARQPGYLPFIRAAKTSSRPRPTCFDATASTPRARATSPALSACIPDRSSVTSKARMRCCTR
jgi:hypothetical protein